MSLSPVDPTATARQTATRRRHRLLSWQHLQMTLPRNWEPIQVTGNYDSGRVLLASARGSTLGIRWSKPNGRRLDPEAATRESLIREVGRLAAAEAQPVMPRDLWRGALLYEEPALPGRDVWSAFSPISGRLVQIVYFANRRDKVMRDCLLPGLVEHLPDRAAPWSIYDFSVIAPADARLTACRFDAGDLSLQFNRWGVRQIAPATLALSRRSLHDWAATSVDAGDRKLLRHYRLTDTAESSPVLLAGHPGITARSRWRRRRRFAWRPGLPAERVAIAIHDADRDRLLLLNGPDEPLLREVATTMNAAIVR